MPSLLLPSHWHPLSDGICFTFLSFTLKKSIFVDIW
jgi:hypothetical protein